jgi:voltage-gated potassium channel
VDSQLILQLAIASAMVALTIITHLVGLGLLIALMRVHQVHFITNRARLDQVIVLLGAGVGLFALHAVEIWLYAGLYMHLTTWRLEEALYFSTTTYTTVGYGDVTLPRAWRVLGSIEAANGVILLGWSTAFFVSVVNRLRALETNWGID